MTWAGQALAIVLLTLGSGTGAAIPQSWPIDSASSRAQFAVRTLWFTHKRGRFELLHGELFRSGNNQDVVDAWIDVRSLAMDDGTMLEQALGPDFFDVQHYPQVHFISKPFADAMLWEGGTLEGMLDLHGRRRTVSFTLLPSRCPAQPLACAVRVHGELSRRAFGMRAHRGLLSDRVVLDLDISLGKQS